MCLNALGYVVFTNMFDYITGFDLAEVPQGWALPHDKEQSTTVRQSQMYVRLRTQLKSCLWLTNHSQTVYFLEGFYHQSFSKKLKLILVFWQYSKTTH